MSSSAVEYGDQIQITGSILTLNIFEQKLMRNFYIINSKIKKLQQIQDLDVKVRALEKEQKFIASKMQAMQEKLPKEKPLSQIQIKQLVQQQIFEVLNGKDQRLSAAKYTQDIMKQIHTLKVDLAKIRIDGFDMNFGQRRSSNPNATGNKLSFNATQIGQSNQQNVAQSQQKQESKKGIPRESLQNLLDPNEMNVVDQYIKEQNQGASAQLLDEINSKFADVYKKIEELKLGKMFNETGDKQLQRFEKYEHYELKSQQTTRKMKEKNLGKDIKLQGIKNEKVKGQLLKNDLYAQYQKAQLIRQQMSKTDRDNKVDGSKSFKVSPQTFTLGFKNDLKNQIRIVEQNGQIKQKTERNDRIQRLKPSKSVKKLDRIERRLKLDDIKDINSVLKQIQLRIQSRVTHDIFMGFVQDIEQKLQILRITKDPTNELSQLRKMIYSLENRLQAVIIFLQNTANEDDALLVKKQWTCISCDKNIDKFNAKVGQHLAWDNLVSKKISPTKAGAFGQAGQLANKIRSLMQNQNTKQGE